MTYLYQHLDKVTTVFILLILSVTFRIVLNFFGQRWISTTSHTATLIILPVLTYVITNVISGNIALSLGMVGALSIVRFRHPVRSPLELSIYFAAITMGITASVSLKWLILLAGSIILAIITLIVLHLFSIHILKKPFFLTSFSEGNPLSTLEVTVFKNIKFLDDSNLLTMKRVTKENIYYLLTSKGFEDLKDIERVLKKDKNVVSYQLNK